MIKIALTPALNILLNLKTTTTVCLCISLALSACGRVTTPAAAEAPPLLDLASFPTENLTVDSANGSHPLKIWRADTAAQRSQGLMFVRKLPKDTGMLFLFGEPQPVSMWMKNTFISLDMLFIAADGRVTRIAQRTEPHSLATIESRGDVSAVLELAGGECARLGINVGDFVRHAAFTRH